MGQKVKVKKTTLALKFPENQIVKNAIYSIEGLCNNMSVFEQP